MIQICNVRPSITNPRRLAILDNSHDAEAAELVTVQYNSRDLEPEICRYRLDEVAPEYPGTRRFTLDKEGRNKTQDIYIVQVGGINTCTCTAGTKGKNNGPNCKHIVSLRALIEKGAL